MERTTRSRLRHPNAFVSGDTRKDFRRALSEPLTAISVDHPNKSVLTDRRGAPSIHEVLPAAESQETRIIKGLAAGGLVVAGIAILGIVFNSNGARVLIEKDFVAFVGATKDHSTPQSTPNQLVAQPKPDPAGSLEPITRTAASDSAARVETSSRDDSLGVHSAAQSQVPPIGSDAVKSRLSRDGTQSRAAQFTASSKSLDREASAALMTRARNLLSRGDFAAARLLLERAANAQDATAAFLLAQTYDPSVLKVRDTRSTTPDPTRAREWYRKAASFGSAEAQQRLTQFLD